MRRYTEIQPSERLSAAVECFWVSHQSGEQNSHRVLPDGCVDLLLEFSCGDRVPRAGLVGTMTSPLLVSIGPQETTMLGVRFRPAAAPRFFDICGQELVDQHIPFEDIEPRRARRLAERMAEMPVVSHRIAVLEDWLGSRPWEDRGLPGGLKEFLAFHSRVPAGLSVDKLSRELGLSRQHLTRLCKRWIGTGPKHLQRILRFRSLIEQVQEAPHNACWADLAARFGYFDQAHLIRDFREFSGLRPGEYLLAHLQSTTI